MVRALRQWRGSAQGREIAGKLADGVFAAELTKASAIEHYSIVKSAAQEYGRSPDAARLELDEPFPDWLLNGELAGDVPVGSIGFRQSIFEQIRQTNPTVRE